jgi:segregation and condensation protein A
MMNTPQSSDQKPTLSLRGFEGPLDLLLQLIEQQRLEITSIALAEVADQYLALVRSAAEPEPGVLAEFLVIGARLLVLKTRALLPPAPVDDIRLQEEDPGDQLVRQLQEYRRFKEVAATLRDRAESGLRMYGRLGAPPLPTQPAQVDPAPLQVTPDQLLAAVERRLRLLRSDQQPVVAVPQPKTLTIAEVAERLRSRLSAQAWMTFDDLLSLAGTRTEVIVTLWTVLELFKRRVITIEQEALFAPITLGRGADFAG